MKKLPQQIANKVVQLRREGLLYKQIAKELGITTSAVGKVCRKYVPELREIAHPTISEEEIQEITRLRRKGTSYEDIGKRIGRCEDTVMKYCQKYCNGFKNICHHLKTPKNIEQSICYLYESGMTQQDVMKKLRIGPKRVRNVLRRNDFVQKRGRRLIRHS